MLQKLLPDGIAHNWALVAPAIADALEQEQTVGLMSRILFSILKEDSEVWTYIDDNSIKALLLITINRDKVQQTNTLFVYSLKSVVRLTETDAQNICNSLEKMASDRGCVSITGLADKPSYIRYLRVLHFDTRYTHVVREVV